MKIVLPQKGKQDPETKKVIIPPAIPPSTKQRAVGVLRNLFVRHAFDARYDLTAIYTAIYRHFIGNL
jgi:hypothetical protein